MRTILYIVQKEFLQIFRDKLLSRAIILVPILQMVILVYCATFEMKSIKIHFVDRDKSTASSELIQTYSSSRFFIVTAIGDDEEIAKENLLRNKADVVFIIPENFGKHLVKGQQPSVQLLLNAINGSLAELSLAYCYAVIRNYSEEIVAEKLLMKSMPSTVNIISRYWYNPELDYKIYMAPGILALLITIIGLMMTGMNLVREKEMGTIEQLNVTPIKKYQFIAGKLIPFLIIGIADLAFGLTIAKILFNIPIEGSLIILFIFTVIYLIAVLGIGLFISTISNTQQQVLFVSFFFIMIFILMSGLFTAVENMPEWGQKLNIINPMAYSIRIIRMVLLKGSGFVDISGELISVSIYAVFTNALAIWRYRKTV